MKDQTQLIDRNASTSTKSFVSRWRCTLLVGSALAWLAISPAVKAVSPAPDGGYPNFNTAEGEDALFSLTTGTANTAVGYHALYSDTIGVNNTAVGTALSSNTSGNLNTGVGGGALGGNTTGTSNTAMGFAAMASNTTGALNTAIGVNALFENISGSTNVAVGYGALNKNKTGGFNTAIGVSALERSKGSSNTVIGWIAGSNIRGDSNIVLGTAAGLDLTVGSNDIDIGNRGVVGESNTIRIGTQGAQTATFIAGISGATVAGGVTVVVDANGQLGTLTSSGRYKDSIQPMDKASEAILSLKPVTFHYKKELDPKGIPQFGLVAEQVAKVNPDLVARDLEGKPYTVRYEAVNAMLLNEFIKEHRKVEKQAQINQQQSAINAQQRKEIEALSATLKEQAIQIQKVSAQLTAVKAAPRLVANER